MILNQFKHILITDIGSTTTKAVLVGSENDAGHFLDETNIPTTVEKPCEDVKIGLLTAVRLLQKKTKVRLVSEEGKIVIPYLTTSSAGGGLQILVFGLSAVDTGKLANMTAYGAGGVILKTFTIDDLVPDVTKMRLIQELHPDLILMAGGIDGGAIAGVVRLAEILSLSEPTPKFHQSERIPLVFAGNVDARRFITEVLGEKFELHIVENIRPSLTETNVKPAQRKVHELFMKNVMERAPGYAGIKKWVTTDIIPTPVGVENILSLYAEKVNQNILMVDIGGATTDIFTYIKGEYQRTVSANIGMSYSISNILADAGIERIMANLPENFSERDVRNYIVNKTLNPTYVPISDAEKIVEQAVAIQGLSLALKHHWEMNFSTIRLGFWKRLKHRRNFNPYEQIFQIKEDEVFQICDINLIIGAGGILSHVDNKEEAMWMLVEGFKPSGITRLVIDYFFKSPHLGVLARLDSQLALNLFEKECLRDVAFVIAPVGKIVPGKVALTIVDKTTSKSYSLNGGAFLYLKEGGDLELIPAKKIFLGRSRHKLTLSTKLPVLFDGRGRGQNMINKELAKSGIPEFSFKKTDFVTRVQTREKKLELFSGEYRIERRLPYEGEILVKEGDEVLPEMVVGKNRFAAPKIYIVDVHRLVGYDRKLTEQEILEGMLAKVGDEVKIGQRIFRAKGKTFLEDYFYCYSPVRGRITQIEKSGMIILREIQDYDDKPVTIEVSKQLGIRPKDIIRYLEKKVGDFVERDMTIAKDLRTLTFVKSPATGVVKEINRKEGTVIVQYDIKPILLKAFVKGKVTKVEDTRKVEITGRGMMFYGVIGFGSENSGEIALLNEMEDLDDSSKNKVVVTYKPINDKFLTKADILGIAGIIAPSIENKDWVGFYGQEIGVALTGDEDISFVLILTEGFGKIEMDEACRKFFTEVNGKIASLSGRTQIRAGVTRPTVIVSE
ncbi:MAG: glutamate mutase L [Candidatus Edwardsbacteria bacterium]